MQASLFTYRTSFSHMMLTGVNRSAAHDVFDLETFTSRKRPFINVDILPYTTNTFFSPSSKVKCKSYWDFPYSFSTNNSITSVRKLAGFELSLLIRLVEEIRLGITSQILLSHFLSQDLNKNPTMSKDNNYSGQMTIG